MADPADAAEVVAETFLVARRVLANLHRGERRRNALADRLRESLTEIAPPDRSGLSDVEVALERLGDDDREATAGARGGRTRRVAGVAERLRGTLAA